MACRPLSTAAVHNSAAVGDHTPPSVGRLLVHKHREVLLELRRDRRFNQPACAGARKLGERVRDPYAALDENGNAEGVLVDIVQAAFGSLGVENVEPLVIDWGAMIPGIQAKRYDMIAAGLYINPKRCKAIAFSEPDVCGAAALLVKKGNPDGLQSVADLAANADL